MDELYLFLATGFEETEAIATLDVLRRASLNVKSISITGEKKVVGAHHIIIEADALFENTDFLNASVIILPGGMPGTRNLNAHSALKQLIQSHHAQGKHLAAICAAPMILGNLGILEGKEATCYPGNEPDLKGAKISEYMIVQDENILTASGPGVALDFGLQIVSNVLGEEKAEIIAKSMLLT